MGLFNKVTNILGISGGEEAGRSAQADLSGVAERLRGFKPIRMRSMMGTSELGPDGLSFSPTAEFAGAQHNISDFFGNATRDLAAFNEGDAADKVLGIMRQKRASLFDTNLSRLESRLQQQGRLGLATGAGAANPELQGFFASEADADLNAQLASRDEARRTGADLLQRATGGLGLFEESAMPGAANLFQLANLQLGRDVSAANIEAGGAKLALSGANADQESRAGFFGSLFSGLMKSGSTPGK